MVNVLNLADYIINLCNHKYRCGMSNSKYKQAITHLYLNKLLYFLNLEYTLNHYGAKTLVPKDTFKIWVYGPVAPSVFSDYQRFGSDRIPYPCKHIVHISFDRDGNVNTKFAKFTANDIPEDVQKFVQAHLPQFLVYSQFDLVNLARLNPQWKDMWEHGGYRQHSKPAVKIPYNFYKDYMFYKNPNHQFWNNYTGRD